MSLAALPAAFLVPPINLLVAAITGALWHRRRAGRILLTIGLGGLAILSLPIVADSLLSGLESGLVQHPNAQAPGAIVILSADEAAVWRDGTRAYNVDALTLAREQAGAALARRTQLPVLVSGGVITQGSPALATLMQASMTDDFAVAPRWAETHSLDTWQNAADSAVILRESGITSVYVVTHGWHMRRALIAFRAAGLEATPAPVAIDAGPEFRFSEFVPSAHAWQVSYYALHEWIGCAWYALRAG